MGQNADYQKNHVDELLESIALMEDTFFILFSIFDRNYNTPINLKYELQKKLMKYKANTEDFTQKLNYNIKALKQKYTKYSKAKFNFDLKNVKYIADYINYLSIIRGFSKIYAFSNEYKNSLDEALSIFNKIKSIDNNQLKCGDICNYNHMDIEVNNHNNKYDNCANQTYNVQLMKSRQKEERMMAGDNIGRMLSSAEGLANICNNKILFIKYQNYDFFDSRKRKNEKQLMEQLMSQIEYAEINYSLYIKDYKQPFPFDEENNLQTICKDIDDMKKVVPLKYQYLYTAMKNLLLRKDNSEFVKKVEYYDNNNKEQSKMDPKMIGAFGVPIVNYHVQKKDKANEEKGNTYKFNLGEAKDPYIDIISAQGKKNLELYEDTFEFDNK